MKEKDMNTIWQVPKYLPYIQSPLTNEVLQQAETKIGYKLPEEYVSLLKIQNGGYIRFTLKGTIHRQIYGIGPYFLSITDFEWLDDYEDLSFNVHGLFPFDGDGHWNICLDYRKNKIHPEITYIDTESDYEKLIADNFKEYLSLLEIDTENEYVIETHGTIEDALKHIEQIALIQFEEPDVLAHGYPVFRSTYKNSWVWVSPNSVPAGFIREEDERYDELKSQMDITALRYPEISSRSLLISVSEETQQKELFSKLVSNGIEIKELNDCL